MMNKRRICFVATVEMAVKSHLLEHIKEMIKRYEVFVIVNTEDTHFLREKGLDICVIPVRIEREISLVSDTKALLILFRLFRKYKFDIVHSIMPKSGLLSMFAAFLARTPLRVHTFTGQVWATKSGVRRFFLKSMDKILVAFATNILIDSNSQREFIIAHGVVHRGKSAVLSKGSIAGVNTERFSPNYQARKKLREKLGIDLTTVTFLFLGRLNKDKGLLDLAKAFNKVCSFHQNVYLMVIGPDEEGIRSKVTEICQPYINKIYFSEYTDAPELYMASADILCLPSYREGFGNVIIEAAAVGIPTIGSRIYGVIDALEDNVTGLLFNAGNVDELADKMAHLIENPRLRLELGENARERVLRDYSSEILTSAMIEYYENLLQNRR